MSTRFVVISLIVLLVLGPACTALAEAGKDPGSSPNVIFIIMDALRGDRVDAMRNGLPVMPNLVNLAVEGVRFRRTTSACSWTAPSIASMFTSLNVDAHQVCLEGDVLADGFETMAEFLHAAGYATSAVQTNGHLVSNKGFAQGFDEYVRRQGPSEVNTEAVTTAAIQQAQNLTQPFFFYVHYLDPHMPYAPPETYRSELAYPSPDLEPDEKAIVEDFEPYYWDHLDFEFGLKPEREYAILSPVGKECVRTMYDGECRYADHEMMRLLNSILTSCPNTFVIITSDHGDGFWEHDQLGHSISLYQTLVNVPLVIKGPGLGATTIDTNVSSVDLLPTVAGLLGLPPRPVWQGRDLFGAYEPNGPMFSNTQCIPPYNVNLEMVRLGSLKLIRDLDLENDTRQLFDLATDPWESVNLASSHPDVADLLGELLDLHGLQNARVGDPVGNIYPLPEFAEEGMRVRLNAPQGSSHRWLKDGVFIEDDPSRFSGYHEGTLQIISAASEDSGQYECLYRDVNMRLHITMPCMVSIRPADSVPAAGLWGLAILIAAISAISVKLLASAPVHRKDSRQNKLAKFVLSVICYVHKTRSCFRSHSC